MNSSKILSNLLAIINNTTINDISDDTYEFIDRFDNLSIEEQQKLFGQFVNSVNNQYNSILSSISKKGKHGIKVRVIKRKNNLY